jgi:hypothetical protein
MVRVRRPAALTIHQHAISSWLTLWSDHADGGKRSRDTAALQIRIVVK